MKGKQIPFKLESEIPSASGGVKTANKEDSGHDGEVEEEKKVWVFKTQCLHLFG